MKQRRREKTARALRADLINTLDTGPAPRSHPERFFRIVRSAGRILGAFSGGLVIGTYLMHEDITIPALAGAAFGVNELVYHLAETLASGNRHANIAQLGIHSEEVMPVLARD